MFCPRCGKEAKNKQNFCIGCGCNLSEDIKEEENQNLESKSAHKESPQNTFSIVDRGTEAIIGFLYKALLSIVIIIGMVQVVKFVGNNLPSHHLKIEKSTYEKYTQCPTTIPELTQPQTLQNLVNNLRDVQNFLILYLKYSDDSVDKKTEIFKNYRKQIKVIETMSNENLLKEDIASSLPQTDKEFKAVASHYNKILAPVGLKLSSDSTSYERYHLKEDYKFTYKKFGRYTSKLVKEYLYLKAKHNDTLLENGGYLAVGSDEVNKRIADFEKFINENPNNPLITEAKDSLYYYTLANVFAEDRKDIKAIKNNTFNKWDKRFIKENKNTKLAPIFEKMITSTSGISQDEFDLIYPYEHGQKIESILSQSFELEDVFAQKRKEIMQEIKKIDYRYIYSTLEGYWEIYSSDSRIKKDSLILAQNKEGGFDIYNNTFEKLDKEIDLSVEQQILINRGELLVYNPQCLQLSRVEFSYGNFLIKTLTSKQIKEIFPDILIINLDNIGNTAVQVTKTTATQMYMLISHAGSDFGGYVLQSNKPIMSGMLSNVFTIDTNDTVNVEWVPTQNNGKRFFISFVTRLAPQKILLNSSEKCQDKVSKPENSIEDKSDIKVTKTDIESQKPKKHKFRKGDSQSE